MIEPIIAPTVGRVLWYYPSANSVESGFSRHPDGGGPYAALIAHVWSDQLVNLTVLDANGAAHSRTSVPLLQGAQTDAPEHAFCGWMPYQKGQAAKTEAAEHARQLGDTSAVWKNPHIGESRDTRDVAIYPQATLCVKPEEPLKAAPIALPVIYPDPDSLEREIQVKADKAPRVTPADVAAEIVAEFYHTVADGVLGQSEMGTRPASWTRLDQVTICALVLRNGAKVVGINYGAVDPAQHSAAMGREEARKAAVEKVWELLGFRLRDKLTTR